MIVPALSNWIFFVCKCKQATLLTVNNPPLKDPGGCRDTTEGHFVVAQPCCYGSPQPLESAVRNTLRESPGDILNEGSFSGICVSGRTVLFWRLTSTHNLIWLSG